VTARTEATFSVLVGLDPRGRVSGPEQGTSPADPIGADTEACIARIIATPRPGAVTAPPARRAPQWATVTHRRTRYGAVGLVASAAIAVITTLLWASPSAGAPPDQAVNVPAQVGPVHSSPRP
jgi:hypothetical protein